MIDYFYAKYRQRNREFQEFIVVLWSYFLGMASIGTILMVIFIWKDISDSIMLTSCLVFYCTTICFRVAILKIGLEIGRFDLQHHEKLIFASTVFHVAVTVATVRTTMIWLNVKEINALVWSQLGLGTISGISTTEFLVVLTGGFRSLEGDLLKLNTERTDSDPIIECKICLVEFSASRIPRILKNCGHTICECCVDTLLRQRYNYSIACPMCQTVTVIDGSSSKLVTNLSVLEFVEEIKTE